MAESKILTGLGLSPGQVVAPVCLFSPAVHRNVPEYTLESEADIGPEIERFEKAVESFGRTLDTAAAGMEEKIGRAEAQIFLAQKQIILDPTVLDSVRKNIQQRKNAEHAVFTVLRDFEEHFLKLEDQYLRERARDLADIRHRLIGHLRDSHPDFACAGQAHCQRGRHRIIVAEEITPSMIAAIDFTKVAGFASEHGGRSSHAAIIARSLAIPAVTGLRGLVQQVSCGQRLLVDGDEGKVYLEPEPDRVNAILAAQAGRRPAEVLDSPPGTEVMANASLAEEVRLAAQMQADGIGLFRTEFMFIRANRLLSEAEQYTQYTEIIRSIPGRPVTFRLLDVGGDKELPFFRIAQEANPYLGWRGARFLLGNPDILASQVRALGRASRLGPVKIMVPMVMDRDQFLQIKNAVEKELAATGCAPGAIPLGAMFEVPSACLQAAEIFSLTDFGSIGSNDLIQYLFAVDRNNERVQKDYNPDHPVLWELLGRLSQAAQKAGKPLSICGEMASLPGLARRLREIGITSLSVSPRFITQVRKELGRGK